MRVLLLSVSILSSIGFISCSKNSVSEQSQPGQSIPVMGYRNLNNLEINSTSKRFDLDVDQDGDIDLSFTVKRDNEDFKQIRQASFEVSSSFYTALPLTVSGELEPMNLSTYIPTENFKGNTWQKEKTVSLLNKNVGESGNTNWTGTWLNAGKRYLAFQLQKNNDRFSAWVELTEDKLNDRIILHKAAYSKVSGKTIKAGFEY